MSPLLTELAQIVQAKRECDAGWAKLAQLRSSLLAKLTDGTTDTSALAGYVSVANRTAKLDVPEIAELQQQIAEARQILYELRAEAIYAAQQALQLAEEQLAEATTSPEIAELEHKLALLVAEHAQSQPQRTASLVVRKRAESLLP